MRGIAFQSALYERYQHSFSQNTEKFKKRAKFQDFDDNHSMLLLLLLLKLKEANLRKLVTDGWQLMSAGVMWFFRSFLSCLQKASERKKKDLLPQQQLWKWQTVFLSGGRSTLRFVFFI